MFRIPQFFLFATALVVSSLSIAMAEEGGLPLHGFASVGGGYSSSKTQLRSKTHGVAVSGLDLYLTPNYGRMRALFEVNIDPDFTAGGEGVDKERAQIGYTFSDNLTAWAGRFHTPFGFWNTAYHHGDWLHNTVRRPRFLDFEDKYGVMPSHTTGLLAEGAVKAGEGKFAYSFFFGNGSRISTDASGFTNLDMNILGVNNSNWNYGTNLGYRFANKLDGLKLGVSYVYEKINTDNSAANPYLGLNQIVVIKTNVNIATAYAAYEANNVEGTLEWHEFIDKQGLGVGKFKWSYGTVASLAYIFMDTWVPYGMYERASFNQQDVYFAAQTNGTSYDKATLGLRYNVNERACIKAQYALTDIHDPKVAGGSYRAGGIADVRRGISHEVAGQFAIRF